jgi:predicted RNase H-like nuclease (RuvC/YqgF family)
MSEEEGVFKDIKALQSSLLVLSQKIKYLVHNEKILGRNILILNKKIASKKEGSGESSIDNSKINEIINKQNELEKSIKSLQATIEMLSKRFAKKEDLKEMKYIIDNINPLEYTTVSQVKKLIKENKD